MLHVQDNDRKVVGKPMTDPKAPKLRNFYPNQFGQFLSGIRTIPAKPLQKLPFSWLNFHLHTFTKGAEAMASTVDGQKDVIKVTHKLLNLTRLNTGIVWQ